MPSATDCECCDMVARHRGFDESGKPRQFCDFHCARARADRVLYKTTPINGTVKDVKAPKPVPPPVPVGML